MPKPWRTLLVLVMVSSVAPVSAERLAGTAASDRHSSECPYERARAEAGTAALSSSRITTEVPLSGLSRTGGALLP
jgi:hypothetical protein